MNEKKRTSYNLPNDLIDKLVSYANKSGLNKSAIVILALREFLEKGEKSDN